MDKRCSRCSETKPRTEFNRFLPPAGYARTRDGLRSDCKSCQHACIMRWRARNHIRFRLSMRPHERVRDQAHPEQHRARARRHRARLAQALTTLTTTEWEAILEAAGHACIYCGDQEQPTMDHLTPISRGGDHIAENVAPACSSCNSSKGAQTVQEWLAELPQAKIG